MRFNGLDLNLLVALDALLTDRSVSTAASRLNLTQSAMSNALARLRRFFNDELLVPVGRGLRPTPLGVSLIEPVRSVLAEVRDLIAPSTSFDPASLKRRFRIATTGYAVAVLLVPLAHALRQDAPQAGLDIIQRRLSGRDIVLEQGQVDLVIGQDFTMASNHPTEILLRDDFSVIGWSENPHFSRPLTAKAFFELPHVALRVAEGRVNVLVDRHIPKGRERNVEVTLTSTHEAPLFIIGTDRIMVLHTRLAMELVRNYPLAMSPAPFQLPVLTWMQQHHQAQGGDVALAWLRQKIARIAAELNDAHSPNI